MTTDTLPGRCGFDNAPRTPTTLSLRFGVHGGTFEARQASKRHIPLPILLLRSLLTSVPPPAWPAISTPIWQLLLIARSREGLRRLRIWLSVVVMSDGPEEKEGNSRTRVSHTLAHATGKGCLPPISSCLLVVPA
ncbi:hypothetical protein NDU88_000608 [Pleurodeles waltl]|uniref:Uncharacterized protein n=1 Tax=Pleurodeles waltl TaxID=8319 RepID=A0AAV7NHP9_PLEWA|nr:hypothetical protein NDU88_000608 [Pleurodeles waltl]